MNDPPRTSPVTLAAFLAGAGLVVGLVVAAVSAASSLAICGTGVPGEQCRGLVLTLATRAGLVAGLAVVFMGLVVVGLLRMVSQDDRQRAERAMEAYRRERDRATREDPSSA